MARVLLVLALVAAFFVVAARSLSAFPPATVGQTQSAGQSWEQASDAPAEPSPAASPTLAADDSDDGADALIAPSPVTLALSPAPVVGAAGASELGHQRALPSHALGLERPPRA